MPLYAETRVIPYAASQVYHLVSDVGSYPEFLPWCLEAHILRKTDQEMVADLVVGQGPLQGTFRSSVGLTPFSRIEVRYAGGPLKHLAVKWLFTPIDSEPQESCRVDFEVDLSLQSVLLSKMMELFWSEAVRRMGDAFEERAHMLYGDQGG